MVKCESNFTLYFFKGKASEYSSIHRTFGVTYQNKMLKCFQDFLIYNSFNTLRVLDVNNVSTNVYTNI